MGKEELEIFSFVFTALNIVSLAKAISSFMKTITSPEIKLVKREESLSIFATMLRHAAMQASFDDYAAKMISLGQITEILYLFDKNLHIFVGLHGADHYVQLFHSLDQFSHFLVFRGQYFRFLHQSRIEVPHCPVPRCALTTKVEENDISPLCTRRELFDLLFHWSLIGIESQKNPDLDVALLIDQNPPDKQQLIGFGYAARVALTYLVPLLPIFSDDSQFTPDFMNSISIIAKSQPSFLKHLLSKHLSLLLVPFAQRALTSELESGSLFLNAITSQFLPPLHKDSMIYSHNTFLKNMSTASPDKVLDYDQRFVQFIYLETGTLLLVDLFYLMHNDVSIRQNAMRMIGQVFPIICLFHNAGNTFQTKIFIEKVSKMINSVSTQNIALRIENAVELSSYCAESFQFATEQFLNRAFSALPSAYLNRRVCSREHLLKIISPWMKKIVFDLNTRSIIENPSRFFVIFSPYSFVESFIMATHHLTPYNLLLPLWESLISDSQSPYSNAKFLTIALIDIAISHPDTSSLIQYILTYIYRLQPETLKILINLLHYGNWYFYHVQLCKFEEIPDMDEFLLAVNAHQSAKLNYSKSLDVYSISINFALDTLNRFAHEDILPFTYDFNVIVSFCLTHIHNKRAFDLLYTMSESLNNSFSSGSPECLCNACEILSRINSIQFDSLKFAPYADETPLRALQKKLVSISDLLSLFIKIYGFLPSDSDDDLAKCLLQWGLSCGDLETASTALNLYSSAFNTIEETGIFHLVESLCLVVRCLVSSNCDPETLGHTSDYICSIFRMMRVVLEKKLNDFDQLFWLPFIVIGLGGPLLKYIVDDALLLIIHIIKKGICDLEIFKNKYKTGDSGLIPDYGITLKDLKKIFKNILINCTSTKILISFILNVFKLPSILLSSDGDFSIYVAVIAPYMCCSIEDPRLFSKICKLSSLKRAVSKLLILYNQTEIGDLLQEFSEGKIKSAKKFATDLIRKLARPTNKELFIDIATIYSSMFDLDTKISINCLYDLCAEIMLVCPSPESLSVLINFTQEATINHELGEFSRRAAFIKAVASYTENNYVIAEPVAFEYSEYDETWISSLINIQSFSEKFLHAQFRDVSDVIRIRFNSVANFPPIFPFEKGFTRCQCIESIANICRKVQVNPQSNWSFSIYCAQDLPDHRAQPGEKPNFDFSIKYEVILEGIIEAIGANSKEPENEQHYQDQQMKEIIEISEEKAREFFVIPMNAFLPPNDLCDEIVKSLMQ